MFIIKASGRNGVKPFETTIIRTGFNTAERACEYLTEKVSGSLDKYNINGTITFYSKDNGFLYEIIEVKGE